MKVNLGEVLALERLLIYPDHSIVKKQWHDPWNPAHSAQLTLAKPKDASRSHVFYLTRFFDPHFRGMPRAARTRILDIYAYLSSDTRRFPLTLKLLIENVDETSKLEHGFGYILQFRASDRKKISLRFRCLQKDNARVNAFFQVPGELLNAPQIRVHWTRHCVACHNVVLGWGKAKNWAYKLDPEFFQDPFCTYWGTFLAIQVGEYLKSKKIVLDGIGSSISSRAMQTAANIGLGYAPRARNIAVTIFPYIQEIAHSVVLRGAEAAARTITRRPSPNWCVPPGLWEQNKSWLLNRMEKKSDIKFSFSNFSPVVEETIRTKHPANYLDFLPILSSLMKSKSSDKPIADWLIVSHGTFLRQQVLLHLKEVENTESFPCLYSQGMTSTGIPMWRVTMEPQIISGSVLHHLKRETARQKELPFPLSQETLISGCVKEGKLFRKFTHKCPQKAGKQGWTGRQTYKKGRKISRKR